MKNIFLKPLASLYAKWVHSLEHRIGYCLEFTYIPDSWINGWMIFDMTKAWAKHNINATGVNYFTVGSLVNGLSSRFIRNEKQYQSWLGAYLVKFNENRNFTLQDHFNLAIADQKNWLKSFGDKNPFIEMSEQSVGKVVPITIGSYQGMLYEFLGGPSHSDVGDWSVNCKTKIIMPIMAEMMNLTNNTLALQGGNFLPKNTTTSYEVLTLKGYIAIIELEKNIKFVLYGNGAVIHNGQVDDDYNSQLMDDILQAFNSLKIKKLK